MLKECCFLWIFALFTGALNVRDCAPCRLLLKDRETIRILFLSRYLRFHKAFSVIACEHLPLYYFNSSFTRFFFHRVQDLCVF